VYHWATEDFHSWYTGGNRFGKTVSYSSILFFPTATGVSREKTFAEHMEMPQKKSA